jgi:hypothetical protein
VDVKSGPELGQADLFARPPLTIPDVAIQFTIQPEAQLQEFAAGLIGPATASRGNRLEPKILEKPALLGAAEANAPRNATGRISRQSESVVSGTNWLVIQYYYCQLADFDQAVEDWPVDQIAQRRKSARTQIAAWVGKPLPPLIQGRWGRDSNH